MRTSENTFIVNPKWRNARYEYRLYDEEGCFRVETFPIRGNEIVDGKLVPVPIMVTVAEAAIDNK